MAVRCRWIRCLLAFLWLLAAGLAHAGPAAQPARWAGLSETLFTHHVGPAGASGTALAQDGSGFIWVGTQVGLLRWDGYSFRSYTADPQTPGSLPDNYIAALHADTRGRLWVGTSAGGLSRFDPASDKFVVYPVGQAGRSVANVSAIADDGEGGLWVGTGAGLGHVDAQGVIRAVPEGTPEKLGLPDGSGLALLRDRAGVLWVGTQKGLLRRPPGAQAFSPVRLEAADGQPAGVTALYQDAGGRVWIGTRAHGAFVIETPQAGARAVRESGPKPTLASDRVRNIVEAVPGEVWIGTDGAGIVVVDTHDWRTQRIRPEPGRATSLADGDASALLRDRSGLVWVATATGISRHDPQQRAVLTVPGGSGRPQGISDAAVPFVLALPDGRVWLSVGQHGIDILDPLRGRVGELRPDPAHPLTALPKARVLALAAGPGGEVYIATRLGLYLSDAAGRHVRRLEVPQRDPTATAWSLCLDGHVLWLGGLDGLWKLDVSDPARPRVLQHDTADRLGDTRVVSILRGTGSSLWVGTRLGLVHVDVASGAVAPVPNDAANPLRMAGGYVSSMLLDSRGRLWLSSFGNGVLRLEGRDPEGQLRFRRLGLREGLPHVGVNKLLEDTRGAIWASTDDGLAVIDADSLAIRTLQRPQGLGILSYWTNAGAVAPTGELLFGGQGGLSVVRPGRLMPWGWRPSVVVTDARVGGAAVPQGGLNAATQGAGGPARLELTPEVRGLWVEFAALDYSAPERNRYAHRLQGFDNDWIPTESTRRLASYTNLPPGDYTLQLRGSNRDGEWSEPLDIPVRVLPAWYQTLWFRGLCGLLALLLVGALVQARTVYLRRRQHELEALVAARTAELQRRSEELHESQRQLEKLAYADPLTGLPNRRLFNEELRRQLAQSARDDRPFTLLLIDLDGFKKVNDTLGHDAGDALLVATAARLTLAVRASDRIARMGGDEFAVLTLGSEHAAVDPICRRIVAALAEPLSFNGAALRVSASIGVAMYPVHGSSPDVLYKAADVALYEAKRAGRHTWRWYGELAVPAEDLAGS
ncbi:MAG TPA: diguanylate cyclase [Burkholderiaceae bacterium]|nr:diguanylate cyclase [Burkholderiaceae bacterium]